MDIYEAAKKCGNSTDTIRRWCKDRGLKYTRINLQGKINISEEDLKHFCDEHGIERREVNINE